MACLSLKKEVVDFRKLFPGSQKLQFPTNVKNIIAGWCVIREPFPVLGSR